MHICHCQNENMFMVKWSFFMQTTFSRRHIVQITSDENLAIYLSLRFRLSITIGLSSLLRKTNKLSCIYQHVMQITASYTAAQKYDTQYTSVCQLIKNFAKLNCVSSGQIACGLHVMEFFQHEKFKLDYYIFSVRRIIKLLIIECGI